LNPAKKKIKLILKIDIFFFFKKKKSFEVEIKKR